MRLIKLSWPVFLGLAPAASLAETLLASHYNGNIYSLSLSTDGGAGKLSIQQSLRAGGRMPSWLTLDPQSNFVYVTDETTFGNPVLTQLVVNDDGKLEVAATGPANGGELHSCLYGGSDGNSFLAAAEYDPSSISTWKLPPSSDSKSLDKFTFTMSGPGPVPARQNKPHPHSTFTDPTGRYVLSADLGADLIRIFRIDSGSGKLTHCGDGKAAPGDGPRHGAWWSPGQDSDSAEKWEAKTLYIVNELGNSVATWKVGYGEDCLSLDRTQAVSTYPPDKQAPVGSKAAEVQVKGNFVYASNRNDRSFGATSDSVATYSIDPDSGKISFIEATDTHTFFPRTFTLNKAGDKVAFGGQTSGTVAIVERNTTTGRLGKLIASLPVGEPGTVNNEDGLSHVVWYE